MITTTNNSIDHLELSGSRSSDLVKDGPAEWRDSMIERGSPEPEILATT